GPWPWPATSSGPPPPTRTRTPGCGCCGSAPESATIPTEARADPLMNTTEALELLEKHPDDTLRAQILALHARALWEARRLDEAASVASDAMELADRVGLAGVVADARTTLARLRERSGETAAS